MASRSILRTINISTKSSMLNNVSRSSIYNLSNNIRSITIGINFPIRKYATFEGETEGTTLQKKQNDIWVKSNVKKGSQPVSKDVELPDVMAVKRKHRNIFLAFSTALTIVLLGTFNYEKQTSPIISSTMYTLRRSNNAREALGNNIKFASIFPWIRGPINHVKGHVDITFKVKGDSGSGVIRLVAGRENRQHEFLISEWSLTTKDGTEIDLLSG